MPQVCAPAKRTTESLVAFHGAPWSLGPKNAMPNQKPGPGWAVAMSNGVEPEVSGSTSTPQAATMRRLCTLHSGLATEILFSRGPSQHSAGPTGTPNGRARSS